MRLLQPRNVPSSLNLLSQDRANYAPWVATLGIAAIPPQLPAAQAAERATATSVAGTGTPTPALVGSVPTSVVEVVPPAANFPTPTPDDVFILVQPTSTPRPVGIIPTSAPVTVPPLPTSVPDTVPAPPTATSTREATPTRTRAPAGGAPTSTVPASTVEPSRTLAPADEPTLTPAPATPRPTLIVATATRTGVPTDVPPTNTPVPPTSTPTPTSTPVVADLLISKTGPATAPLNADVTYSLTVTNLGPAPASSVVLRDTPAGMRWAFVSASPATLCTSTVTEITCALGTLAPGESTNVAIVVRPGTLGTLSNTATVDGAEGDPVPANNTAVASTVIEPAPAADVRVSKARVGSGTIGVGDNVTYSVTVTNDGPVAATGVVLVDTPSGVDWTFISATFGARSCANQGASISCNLGTLTPQESVEISLVILPSTSGTLVNRASVSANESDPDTGNNVDQVTSTVVTPAIAGLSINSTVETGLGNENARNGSTPITYTITIENTTAGAVTVERIADNFQTFAASGCGTPTGTSCTLPIVLPGTVVWEGPVTLGVGDRMTLEIYGQFTNAPLGQACNPAYTVTTSIGIVRRTNEACVTIIQ
ncbi:MAG: hypothetical protein RLZZ387_3246 [Chloroflexota bacterium]